MNFFFRAKGRFLLSHGCGKSIQFSQPNGDSFNIGRRFVQPLREVVAQGGSIVERPDSTVRL